MSWVILHYPLQNAGVLILWCWEVIRPSGVFPGAGHKVLFPFSFCCLSCEDAEDSFLDNVALTRHRTPWRLKLGLPSL